MSLQHAVDCNQTPLAAVLGTQALNVGANAIDKVTAGGAHQLFKYQTTFTGAQVLTGFATPVQILPAIPGCLYVLKSATVKTHGTPAVAAVGTTIGGQTGFVAPPVTAAQNAVNYAVFGVGGAAAIYINGVVVSATIPDTFFKTATPGCATVGPGTATNTMIIGTMVNQALRFGNDTAAFTLGVGTQVTVNVEYEVHSWTNP